MTGEGGDNVFSTPLYLIADRAARGRLLGALRLVEQIPNIAYHPWRSLRLRLLRDYGLVPLLPKRLHRRLELRQEASRTHLNAWRPSDCLERECPAAGQALGGPRWWAEKADHFGAGSPPSGSRSSQPGRRGSAG